VGYSAEEKKPYNVDELPYNKLHFESF